VVPAEKLETLAETVHYIDELCNLTPNPNAPYVGRNAFAHKGGMHVAGSRPTRAPSSTSTRPRSATSGDPAVGALRQGDDPRPGACRRIEIDDEGAFAGDSRC